MLFRTAVVSRRYFCKCWHHLCRRPSTRCCGDGDSNYRNRFEAQSRASFPWMAHEQEREKRIVEREPQAMDDDGIDDSDKLPAIANRIFTCGQERQRQERMADQEQGSPPF